MRHFLLSLYAVVYCTTLISAQCTGPVIINYPYQQDFEGGMGGWVAGGLGNDWAWGTPSKPTINSAGGGTKCWVVGGLTNSFYQFGERSYVESPCFNFAILTRPYIRFKIWWESEQRFDGTNLQYSLDAGNTWTNVGSVDDPVNCLNDNWFNSPTIANLNGLANVREGWSGNIQATSGGCLGGNGSGGWVVANHCMTYLAGQPSVKFRFTFGAGTTCNNFDGVAFDDIYIANSPAIVAAFSPTCAGGTTYTFNNVSTLCPETWSWDFGDPASGAANLSTDQNPSHTYPGPGIYTVNLIASSLCSGSTTATRTVTILGATATATPVSCAGGSNGTATVQVSFANTTPVYQWNTVPPQTGATATNLSAGTYTVTLAAAGVCEVMASVTVTEPTALQHITTVQNAACGVATGSVTVNESGGTPPYTYVWSPSGGNGNTANNLAAGNYVLSVTDQQGCLDTVQVSIISTPSVQTSITNVVPVACFGNQTGSATVSATSGTAPFTYLWSPMGGTSPIATGLAAGAYQVTVTDANLCTATATANITQPATALQHTTTTTAAACGAANGTATITETGGTAPYTFLWSPLGGTNATAINLSSGNYVVTVTDSRACTDTIQINIGNIGGVQAAISMTTPVGCFGGQDGSATVAATGGATPYTYIWSPSGGNGATATGLAAGNYFVTVTDANQCIVAVATSISQATALEHTTTSQPAICGAPNGSATVVPTGGTAPYTYSWSPAGGTGSTANNLAAGNYVVSITDQKGCLDTAQVRIVALPNVQAVLADLVPVTCFGGSNGSATVQGGAGAAPYTYAWSPAGGTGSVATGLAAGTYTATVTDANQCTATATATITQPTALIHIITALQNAACNMATGSATVQETGGTAPYAYVWSPAGGTGSTANGLVAGNYVVSVTDQSGCTDTVQITIGDIPGVQATISTTVNADCFGSNTGSATVTATVGALPYTYAWSPTGGNAATAVGLLAGTYIVTVTDANACTATATAMITQPAALQSTTTISPVSCGGMNGAAMVSITGGTSPYTYLWQPTGGNAATASGLEVGNYSVLVSDQRGCTVTIPVSMDSIAGVQASIATVQPISCLGAQDGSLTAAGIGGTLPYQYVWSLAGNGTTLSGLAPGSYSVTVTDAAGCTSIATATLLDATPVVTLAQGSEVRCYGEKNGFIGVDITTGGTPPYLYALDAGGFGAQTLFSPLAGGDYVLQTQDANGCLTSNSITINEPPLNTIQIGNDTTIHLGDSLLLAAVVADPGRIVQYEWKPPTGVTCATCPVTFAHPVASIIYTLYATDSNGCVISDSRLVMVKKAVVFIPNVFAPDSDQDNDYFTLYSGFGVEEVELLQVYDRWGELVFENQNFAPSNSRSGWNGQVRGQVAAAGVYAYLIRVRLRDGSTELYEGDVTVVR